MANVDFITILREIRGSAAPGQPITDGIWYELTIADTNGNPGIYGDILAKYGVFGDNADAIQILADNIAGIKAIVSAINAGVDFEEVMTLIPDVAALETAMSNKVDKVAGSSLMTTVEHTKLQAIADGANNYVHPSKHAVSILDGGTNYNKVVKTDGAGNVGFGDVPWADIAGKPVSFTPSAHEHAMSDIPSGSLSATRITTTETRQFITAEQATALLDMEVKTNKGIPLGYAPLDANGKINPSFLNDLNLIEVFTPADFNSMLNLNSAQPGDIAYRLDTNNTYMLAALPVNVKANWKQLNAGLSVVSVNGLSGAVNLDTSNISEGGSNYYFTNERVDDRVATLLQAGTNVTISYDDVSNTLTINANYPSVGGITATMVGLGNVNNTSDANKPISTAQQTALNLKANLASPTFTGTVVLPATTSIGTITNKELGYLYGVTSAVQTQIDTKAPLASPTFTGTVGGITATMVGLGNVNNTSDANKPVSTAQAAAIALKADQSTTYTKTEIDDAINPLKDVVQNLQNAPYVLDLTDRGKSIDVGTGGITIRVPTNSEVKFPIGAVITVTNLASTAITIAQTSGMSIRQAGTTNTGNRTLAAYGMATLRKVATDTWFISGAGLS